MMGRVKIWGRQFEGIDWMAAWLADVCLRDLSRGNTLLSPPRRGIPREEVVRSLFRVVVWWLLATAGS